MDTENRGPEKLWESETKDLGRGGTQKLDRGGAEKSVPGSWSGVWCTGEGE